MVRGFIQTIRNDLWNYHMVRGISNGTRLFKLFTMICGITIWYVAFQMVCGFSNYRNGLWNYHMVHGLTNGSWLSNYLQWFVDFTMWYVAFQMIRCFSNYSQWFVKLPHGTCLYEWFLTFQTIRNDLWNYHMVRGASNGTRLFKLFATICGITIWYVAIRMVLELPSTKAIT